MPKRLSHLIDLNLLEVFLAVYRHQNLTAAGQELGLSQPAMSRALSRLRDSYGDSLFVRHPHGVIPTPYADELSRKAHDALEIVRGTLVQPQFDPRSESRVFVLAMSDISEQVFLPDLATALAREAPGIRLRTSQLQGKALLAALASGAVDLALGNLDIVGDGVKEQLLFSAKYACIARNGHPAIGRILSRKNFVALPHVVATGSMTAHARVLEDLLASPTIQATIGLRVGHFLSIGRIVAQTDLIATIPDSLARTFEAAWNLTVHEVPVSLPTYDVCQFWHERYDREPGSVWLRRVVSRLFEREEPRTSR